MKSTHGGWGSRYKSLVTQLTPWHGGPSSALQSLEGWQLTPQQISWLRQQRGPRVVAECTRASSQDCIRSQAILTPPLFCSCPRIVPALKLTVPAGRKSRKYGYCNKWIRKMETTAHVCNCSCNSTYLLLASFPGPHPASSRLQYSHEWCHGQKDQ